MKVNKFVLALCCLSFLGNIILLFNLPQNIPIHWGFYNNVNGYGSRWYVLIGAFLPLIAYCLMILLFKFVAATSKNSDSVNSTAKIYELFTLIEVIFCIGFNWTLNAKYSGFNIDISSYAVGGSALLFILLGNYMGRIKPNSMFGIRTPWTLANGDVWRKTHRVGGRGLLILGIIIFTIDVINSVAGLITMFTLLIVGTILITVYSYTQYKRIVG